MLVSSIKLYHDDETKYDYLYDWYRKQLREEAIKGLQSFLLLEEVGQKEQITVTDEELEFELAKMADQYKMTIDEIKNALGRQLGQFRNNMRMNRIEDFLYENNK